MNTDSAILMLLADRQREIEGLRAELHAAQEVNAELASERSRLLAENADLLTQSTSTRDES